jgi:hypothetical protein
MADFYRTGLTDDWATLKGAARLLVADIGQTFPAKLDDIIKTSGSGQYDAQPGWEELGATKGGVTLSTNHTEETITVDQVFGDIDSAPTAWEASVQTALAEMTLEHLQIVWEGSAITTNVAGERVLGYGQPDEYTKRRLAVLYKHPKTDKIRATVVRIAQLQPVESSIVFNREGDQMTIPVQFKALADTSISDPKQRFFVTIEQPGA